MRQAAASALRNDSLAFFHLDALDQDFVRARIQRSGDLNFLSQILSSLFLIVQVIPNIVDVISQNKTISIHRNDRAEELLRLIFRI